MFAIEITFEIVFWVCVAALAYAYVGYPLLLALLSKIVPRPVAAGSFLPTISLIITAYNEEADLAAKLENTLLLDYPKNLLQVIVASDCSTDRTDEIVRSFSDRGVQLCRQPQRFGKTSAQNRAVEVAKGEIILFSDATTLYQQNVLRLMVQSFTDPTVGCVAGRLVYLDPGSSTVGQGARSYWGYETFLKERESLVCSLIGVSGCLYAVRKSAYIPLYPEACSDFIIATKMVEQGLRAVYEPAAFCTEDTNRRTDKELRMRIRVITQTFSDLWRHKHMLNPVRAGFYAIELLSHKVLRYAVPLFLIAIFIASAVLARSSSFYAFILLGQILFYVLAFIAWILEVMGLKNRVLALPYYFVLTNIAVLVAAFRFMRGERYATWEPIREGSAGVSVPTRQ